jgi:hypothetical protein
MKRIFFLLIVCISSYSSWSQSGFFVKNAHIEKWHREGGNLSSEVQKAVKLPEFQSVVKKYEADIEALMPDFHFIDFNNNGELDILFNGKIGSQPYVFIFLKKGNSYLVLLEEKGVIIQANLPDEDNALNLSIWHEACCGYYVSSLTQLACVSNNNTSYFNTTAKSLIFKETYLPSARIKAPVKCTFINVANLRTEPEVNNQVRIAGNNGWAGNTLGIYATNATGTIYAEVKDSKGKFWYFVRMNNETGIYIHSDRFTNSKEVEDAQNCFYYGWVNSNDVRFE